MVQLVAASICEERIDNGTSCIMLTPTLDCIAYTYETIHQNGTVVNNGTLSLLNNSIYWFNFTLQTGDYIIKLCDDSTREFRVTETYDTKFQREVTSRMYGALAAFLGLMVIVFLVMTIVARKPVLKMLFLFMMFGSLTISINTAKLIAESQSASQNIINMLITAYKISLWTMYIMAFIVFIYAMYKLFLYLKESAEGLRSPKKGNNKEFRLE